MAKPKKVTSWRTCPECGSRATKILHLSTGQYHCQICDHQYNFGGNAGTFIAGVGPDH
jgi:ribosomal protein L37AE/L43A